MNLIKLPVNIGTFHIVTPTVNFYYPVVQGLINFSVQQKMNQAIYNLMLTIIRDLKRSDLITYISGSYEVKTNQRNVLSLSLNGLGDFHGAHPITIVKSLNFDVLTGKNYVLKELFKPGSDYQKILSDIISQQIQERDIPLLGEFKGIRPDQDYYIADKTIIIYFQQYEISPYYVGFPYFPIPIYQIENIINEDGLPARMIAFF
jgi:hypothetical protein